MHSIVLYLTLSSLLSCTPSPLSIPPHSLDRGGRLATPPDAFIPLDILGGGGRLAIPVPQQLFILSLLTLWPEGGRLATTPHSRIPHNVGGRGRLATFYSVLDMGPQV